ncbi:MAG TPA: hypothetical protein VK968_17840 [Roseimicrobium sp.]|nr:hypothetical protein [Roseimicrobium sp.]
MNANPEPAAAEGHEPETEITPVSGHGKMPLILLGLWIGNVSFFVFYFIKYGWADLMQWVNR